MSLQHSRGKPTTTHTRLLKPLQRCKLQASSNKEWRSASFAQLPLGSCNPQCTA
jgi:hypothetical protein